MKKFFLIFLLLILFLMPVLTIAQGLVPCGKGDPTLPDGSPNPDWKRCELADLFKLVENVYGFIVLYIATPLAGLVIVMGGVIILISGGPGGLNPITGIASPNLYNTGKNMVTGAILGMFLILGGWLIINTVLNIIGYNPPPS